MIDTWPLLQKIPFPSLYRNKLETLQINLGYTCNQKCQHCHVNAGPERTEQMSRETIEQVLVFIDKSSIKTVDLTGGAPEMHPHFKMLVESLTERGIHVIDRCNLTILTEPGFETMADFLARHGVEIMASLPCYLEENVDKQRGKGVFSGSLQGLRQLNHLGYGREGTGLVINLVYNPVGNYLPPEQGKLEQDYHDYLSSHYDLRFNQLFAIINMPIKRFGSSLVSTKQFDEYMALLQSTTRMENLAKVMCLSLISLDWQGYVYDCDFNQMLALPMMAGNSARHISEINVSELEGAPIRVAGHCYGCTAGSGSSCQGALG